MSTKNTKNGSGGPDAADIALVVLASILVVFGIFSILTGVTKGLPGGVLIGIIAVIGGLVLIYLIVTVLPYYSEKNEFNEEAERLVSTPCTLIVGKHPKGLYPILFFKIEMPPGVRFNIYRTVGFAPASLIEVEEKGVRLASAVGRGKPEEDGFNCVSDYIAPAGLLYYTACPTGAYKKEKAIVSNDFFPEKLETELDKVIYYNKPLTPIQWMHESAPENAGSVQEVTREIRQEILGRKQLIKEINESIQGVEEDPSLTADEKREIIERLETRIEPD